MTVDTDALKAANPIETVVGHYAALTKKGSEYVTRCVFHAPDNNPSMWVVPAKGIYHCFSCGASGDVLDFIMEMEGLDFTGACERLNGGKPEGGWQSRPEPERVRKPQPDRITEKPPGPAPESAFKHRDFGMPDDILPFKDAGGDVLGYECRWKRDGGKESRMLTYGKREGEKARWTWAHFTAPRPLFGLDQLAARPGAQVLVFEGPIKARDAQGIFPYHACVSWSGGAKSWHRHEWDVLRGRSVVIWPDNDTAGIEACQSIAAVLADPKGLACPVVKWVDPNRQPDGWDIRDAIAEGWDDLRIKQFAKERARTVAAEPAEPEPQTEPSPEPEPAASVSGDVAAAEALASVSPDTAPTPEVAPQAAQRAKSPRLRVVSSAGAPEGNAERVPDPEDDAEPKPWGLSPDSIADNFAAVHQTDWRFTNEWSKWLYWGGDTWRVDKTDLSFQRMREVCRSACYWPEGLAATAREKRALTYRSYIGGALHLAGRDRRLAARAEDWDADPMLLGIPGGAIDLRVGKMIEGAREQLISRQCGTAPEPGECPTWRAVLSRATRGDDSMLGYLQRVAGYIATGDTREECFFFVYGPGASGKSTFARVLSEVLGDYAQGASIEAFMHRDRTEHLTELARMSGARLITATETDEGARLNEARIKVLTGRDRISARFMRGDMFDFVPTAKILLVGNHKPQLRSVGEEMRRRIHLIEFPDTIPDEERDKSLPDRLRAEYPAILHWIIQGALLWADAGLGKPEPVETATREYLASEDTLGAWLDDCTIMGGRVESGAAYRSYSAWADKQGEHAVSAKRFIQRLQDRGFTRTRSARARFVEGLSLRDSGGSSEPSRRGYDQD